MIFKTKTIRLKTSQSKPARSLADFAGNRWWHNGCGHDIHQSGSELWEPVIDGGTMAVDMMTTNQAQNSGSW